MELLVDQIWLVVGTFFYCIGSGIIPVMNAEVYLLAASAAAAPGTVLPLIIVSGLGQMVAKSVMYLTGRGVLSLPVGKHQARLDTAAQKLQGSKVGPGSFNFVSAFTGFPPFYVVSILAGTLKVPFPVFFLSGTAGRLLRFAIIVLFPQLAKGLWA